MSLSDEEMTHWIDIRCDHCNEWFPVDRDADRRPTTCYPCRAACREEERANTQAG